METIIIQTDNREQSKTIKAVLKALKVKFKAEENSLKDALKITESIRSGYKEMQDIEAGKIKPTPLKDLLNEL
jgi:hypothetical protein